MSSQDTGLLTQFSELDAGTLKSLLTQAADVLLFINEDGLINDIIVNQGGRVHILGYCGEGNMPNATPVTA